MESSAQAEEAKQKLAKRGLYCLVMGVGAFFALFNTHHGWVTPPKYERLSQAWVRPITSALEPWSSQILIALGIGFLVCAAYCIHRVVTWDQGRR